MVFFVGSHFEADPYRRLREKTVVKLTRAMGCVWLKDTWAEKIPGRPLHSGKEHLHVYKER